MNQTQPDPAEQTPSSFGGSQSQSEFEFDFFGEIVRRGTNNVHVLRQHAELLVSRGERAAALVIERKLGQLLPYDPIVRYNLACGLAVADEADEAYEQLVEAIRLGYRDFELMENDADLDALRNHEGFLKLIEDQRNVAQRKAGLA